MQKYRLISRQGEGTFSEVFKAQSVKTGRYTAIKCMKNKFDSIEQVRICAGRQSARGERGRGGSLCFPATSGLTLRIACPSLRGQVNNLREIQALRRLSPHPNIISLIEVLYDQPTGRLALVFELMQRNIYELIRGRRHYLNETRVKSYMYQLIKAMDHMHRNGIFHRDIKPVRPPERTPAAA
jgi:renal tumor antigen